MLDKMFKPDSCQETDYNESGKSIVKGKSKYYNNLNCDISYIFYFLL